MLALKTALYGPQFTRQHLIEKSIHLLSLWQLKHSVSNHLFIVFLYCLCEYAARENCWLFYFHIFYLTEKWGCKKIYWDTNSFLPARFEPCEKKKYLSVTSCLCATNIHYTSSILVKIMLWNQLFLHMLTIKSLT